ncbi:MAG: MarR family transcriptional regulator [Azospirillaceae bacterium]
MKRTQENLSRTALAVFAINGQLLDLSNALAAPAGLTATEWQVLGAVLKTPLTQAQIARRMGITRQSVQRTAKQLVARGLAARQRNPDHRKAMLMTPTEAGMAAISRINPGHAELARRLEDALGVDVFARIAEDLETLTLVLDQIEGGSRDDGDDPEP